MAMLLIALHLWTTFHLLVSLSITAKTPLPYTPTDYFLVNCGLSSNLTSPDGRHWEGDSNSKFSPHNIHTTSSTSEASQQDSSVSEVPYMTARIFQSSNFTYSFPVSPGPKFLRLYFNPASYSNLDKTRSFFSVSANDFTLLTNFSAFLTVLTQHPSAPVVVKEFIVNVLNSHHLNLTFIPSSSSYAFINGIEIVSMPNNLYLWDQDSDESAATFVNFQPLVCSVNTIALETMYRLNVGGQVIPDVEDTGMFRTWKNDEDYIYGKSFGTLPHLPNVTIKYSRDTPVYTAPKLVYSTSRTMGAHPEINLNYNLTWIFSVDTGFIYLIRLHFCETQLEVTKVNQRVFRVFIYNQTAEEAADVIQWSGGSGIPVYKDYLVWVPKKIQGKQDLWLALHPNRDLNPKPEFADVILNGVEIFKLNQSEGSLAGPNPELVVGPTSGFPKEKTENKNKNEVSLNMILIGTIGGASFAMLCNLFLLAYWQRRRKRTEESGTGFPKSSWVPFSKYWWSTNENVSSLPLKLSRYFSIAEIKAATRNFDNRLVIGAGGFGNVYKGHIQDESTVVAIKRLNPSSRQGTREFWTEIQMLSSLRHVNLVALLGYCDDLDEMILVYEYVARGTLRDHLYKSKNPPLTWEQRLRICIHAARGLNFLHTGAKQMIIHRDVKATNILLDENLTAKVSDFGLSKLGPDSRSQTHVTTVVKGSLGYVDPEYYRRQRLTEKSDVYSFGVVLFEVLCARPAMMPGLPKEQVSLAHWARKSYQSGTLDGIIDPFLKGKIAPECLNKFGEIADSCLRDEGIERPLMRDVLWALEYALQIQENAEMNIENGNGVYAGRLSSDPKEAQASPSDPRGEATASNYDDLFSASGGHALDSRSTSRASSEGNSSTQMGWSSILNSTDKP